MKGRVGVGLPRPRGVRAGSIAALLAVTAVLPPTWVDGQGVLGVPWRTPESRLTATVPGVHCEAALDPAAQALGFRQCSGAVALAGVPGRANFWFRHGGLVAVTIRLRATDARRLAAGLREQHGPGSAVADVTFPEPVSTAPEARLLQWTIGGTVVWLTPDGARRDALAVAVPREPSA